MERAVDNFVNCSFFLWYNYFYGIIYFYFKNNHILLADKQTGYDERLWGSLSDPIVFDDIMDFLSKKKTIWGQNLLCAIYIYYTTYVCRCGL